MSPQEFARLMNNLTPEQVAQSMESLPTDALEFAVQFEALAHPGPLPTETAEQRADRYERALQAIMACTLMGSNFGDYVQATCDDVLAGGEPECPLCGTAVHEGPCISEDGESSDRYEGTRGGSA